MNTRVDPGARFGAKDARVRAGGVVESAVGTSGRGHARPAYRDGIDSIEY